MSNAVDQSEGRLGDERLSSSPTGMLLVCGGVFALVGNLLHPRFDQDNQVDVYRAVDIKSDRLLLADLVLIVATLLIAAGLLETARLLSLSRPTLAARLGAVVVASGGAIAIVQYVVEGYALRQAAHIFAISDFRNRVGAFWATSAVDRINTALFSAWTLLLLGAAPLLLAAAMWTSTNYPKWVSAVGAVGGVACVVTAIVNTGREDQSTLALLFLGGSVLVTVWVILTGWLLLRPAWRASEADEQE